MSGEAERVVEPCPFCGVDLERSGDEGNWAWQHTDPAGEGCLLAAVGAIYLQDDDDIAAWNTRAHLKETQHEG